MAKIVSDNGATERVRAYPWRARVKSSYLAGALATAYVCALFLLTVAGAVTPLATGCAAPWKGSVGAVLGKDNRTGRVFVREAPPEMAAAKAGLAIDDEILAIDDSPVSKMTPQEVHEKLSGNVGTKVKLTYRRAGEPPRDVEIERGPLKGEAGR